MAKAADVITQYEDLKTKRNNWDEQGQENAKYCLPHKATVQAKKPQGAKVDPDVYDSTAIFSAQVAAAGLHGFMTNPASRWFTLKLQDKERMNSDTVKQYLKLAEEKIFSALNGSNFNDQIAEFYSDWVIMPCATLYEEQDPLELIRFYSRPFEETYIAENERGRVDLVYRPYTLTLRQAFAKWGQKLGAKALKLAEAKKWHERLSFLHATQPRPDRDVSKADKFNMPFQSLYISLDDKKILEEGGYREFPFFIGRWRKRSGEVYAYTPASIAMPDIKMLNNMSLTILKAAIKVISPPFELPHENYLMPLNMGPDGANIRTGGPAGEGIQFFKTGANIPLGLDLENQRRDAIKKYFFTDMFLMLIEQPKNMTAFEVAQRIQEKMRILGPVIGKLMTEVLNPLIQRTFSILLEIGAIPEPPEELLNSPYIIEYVSPLAQAQKLARSQNIQAFMAVISQMGEIAPQVFDKINFDKAVDELGDIHSIDPNIMQSDANVKKIREARLEAQKQEAQIAQAQLIAKAAKDGGAAVKSLGDASA